MPNDPQSRLQPRTSDLAIPTDTPSGAIWATVLYSLLIGIGLFGCDSVAGRSATSVDIIPSAVSLLVGDSLAIDYTATPSDDLIWISSDSTIVTVTGDGIIFGEDVGTAVVSGNIDNVTDTVHVTVEAASPSFTDGFESGDLTHSENGVSWTTATGGTAVTTNSQYDGEFSLAVSFPGEPDGEDSFEFAQLEYSQVDEIWVEYWIRIPNNYHHRHQESSANNKFFQVWGGSRNETEDGTRIGANLWPNGDYAPEESNLSWANTSSGAEGSERSVEMMAVPFITPDDYGQWIQLRWHWKVSTLDGCGGVLEFWRNGTLQYSDYDICGLHSNDSTHTNFDTIRLLGWSNSGYDEQVTYHFDNIRVFTDNPGW